VPFIGQKMAEILHEGGVPEDVFIIVQGPGSIGEGMIEGGVDHLVFTGSVEIGRHVNKLCAEKFISTTMELGGKDPMIVLDDADLDSAAAGAVWGAFANSGQTCASVERVYVMEKVYDAFVDKVLEKTKKLRQGIDTDHNVDVGAMTSRSQLDIVERHVEDARKKGANIRTGGSRRNDLPGMFFEPTVITEVDETMACMIEETFGPTLPIRKVNSEDEAVRLANDSPFGLTASIWSTNIPRAKRLASRIVTGTVTINDALSTFGMAETPWGGVKESGTGRTHGEFGLKEMTRPLHVCVDIQYTKFKPWWYPYDEKLYKGFKSSLYSFTSGKLIDKGRQLLTAVRYTSLKNKY
jgi:succinate-semialdehyde dehydrogenase/glutarate-semialdehyde dehydrogenase